MDNPTTISLSEVLAQNAELVLNRLITQLTDKGSPNYRQMPVEVLKMRVQKLFDAFWQGMSQNDPKPLVDYIRRTSRERGGEGFKVADLQTVGLCLRDELLNVVDEAYADQPEQRLKNSRKIEELILTGIGAGVQGFVDGREALIMRQFEALMRSRKKGNTDSGTTGPD